MKQDLWIFIAFVEHTKIILYQTEAHYGVSEKEVDCDDVDKDDKGDSVNGWPGNVIQRAIGCTGTWVYWARVGCSGVY